MTKLSKISLAAIGIGISILGLMLVYYYLHLGVKPCKGLPTDASNCGDADFGGVYFLLIGAPLILSGGVGCMVACVRYFLRR